MGRWGVWAKGVAAAVIGGAASALGAQLSAPEMFIAGKAGLLRLLKLSLVGAVIHAAAYLKQSPLPAGVMEE